MNKILISFLLLFSLFSSCSSPEVITLSPDGDEDVKPTIPIEKYKLSVEKPEHAKLQIEPPAPQTILIIRCLYCLHPKMHPEIKMIV